MPFGHVGAWRTPRHSASELRHSGSVGGGDERLPAVSRSRRELLGATPPSRV